MAKFYRIYRDGVEFICLLAIEILNLKAASVLSRQPSLKEGPSLEGGRQDV